MADVAFVPEGTIFQGCHHVAAQHAGQATDPLTADGVAFVGHGRTALLPLGEVLLHLEHVGALQVADLGGEALKRRSHQGQGLDVLSMAIAGDHLGAGGVGHQPELGAGDRLDLGIGVGVGAHGATDLAHAHHPIQPLEALLVAEHFGQPASHLETKGDRFAMDGVGAANHHRALVGADEVPQGIGQLVELGAQQLHRGLHLEGYARIQHVGAGHAHVDEAARIAHVFIHVGEEGDHVVAHFSLDLEDAIHAESRLLFNGGDRLGRDPTQLTVGFCGGNFHIEPALEFGLFAPDGAHFGQGVTLDQGPARGNSPTNVWGGCIGVGR